jgi:alkylation response protein AidB-like acyl-CoA dehydrogenase
MTEPEHIREYRDVLQRFVENEMPREAAAEWDRTDTYPREIVEKLAELGVMGLTIPEEYGGMGRDIVATMVVIEELCKRSTAISGPFIMATCYGGMNIVESGSEQQKQKLLPKLARGEILFAYGLTEPDVGADLASVKTRVERRGDKLVVNGTKRFCTGARYADYIYTLGCSDPDGARYKNLSLVLVPCESDGIEITDIDRSAASARPTCISTMSRLPRKTSSAASPAGTTAGRCWRGRRSMSRSSKSRPWRWAWARARSRTLGNMRRSASNSASRSPRSRQFAIRWRVAERSCSRRD